MKVLHVIWHLGQGGAQTYLYNLLKEQTADEDMEPQLLVLSTRGVLSDQFEQLLKVRYLNMFGGSDLLRAVRLPAILREANAQLIHSHSNNLIFNFLLDRMDLPTIYTEHGGGLLGGRRRDYLIYRRFSRSFRRVIGISQEMARVMADASPLLRNRIDVVYNGINVEEIAVLQAHDGNGLDGRIANARFCVGIIGRLEHQKGIDLFIESAAKLREKRDDIIFLVIGEGSLRLKLEQLAYARGIASSIFFLGYRADALRILKTLDLFLFTSNYEPFGLVITESMAAQVPVVAVHTQGAVPEIISDGVNGIIVTDRDPCKVADAVDRLLSNDELRLDIIKNAFETVRRRFTIEINAKGVKDSYMKCL